MMSHFDGRAFLDAARKPMVVIAASCGLAFFLVLHLTKFKLSAVWPPSLRGDAEIFFQAAQQIFAQKNYSVEELFPYPPSAVLIFRSLGIGGPAIFMSVWYLLMAAGLIVTMRASLAQERPNVKAAWLVIGFIAMLAASSPISWDLRSVSSNLVYLGLVMAGYGLLGSLPIVAGALIGLSVSLKLYSGLLLLWLLVIGPRRAVGAAGVAIIILWVILPAILFGMHGTVRLYSGWVEQLRIVSDPLVHAKLAASNSGGAPIITLQRSVVHLTGGAFGSAATLTYVWIIWSIWLAALLWYFWRYIRDQRPVTAPSRAALADWTVLLFAQLPFSPWIEPYHLVPLFVGTLLCVVVALDETMIRRDRMAALAVLATVVLLFIVIPVPFDFRGFRFVAQLFVFVLVLASLRPRLGHQAYWRAEQLTPA
jgi:hypothetical protein